MPQLGRLEKVATVASQLLLVLAMGSSGTAFGLPASQPPAHAVASKYPAEALLGEWWTEGREGRVEFVKGQDGTYLGILRWSSDPKRDVNNKDPKQRDRSVVGIVLMWNLTYEDGEYTGGYVYNPRDGAVYRMKVEVLGRDALKIRGYMGIALFGQSQEWARYR